MLQVYAAAALVAAASVLFDIADHAYLPGLVGKPLVTDANAKFSVTESVAEMGGPALAGVLFQWLTAPIAVAVNAATYIVSAVILARIREPEPPARPGRHQAAEGWIDGVVTGARTSPGKEPRVRSPADHDRRPATACSAASSARALHRRFALRGLGLGPAPRWSLGIATGGVGATGGLPARPADGAAGRRRSRRSASSGALSALGTMILLLSPANAGQGGMAGLMVSQFLGDAFGVVPLILATSLRQIAPAA